MSSVNRVILLGNVGKDPVIRSTQSGVVVADFTLATSEKVKGVEKPEWHNVVAFDKTAGVVRDYVKKGSKLYVEGKLQTQSWDDKETGQKRYKTVILASGVVLLSHVEGNKYDKQETAKHETEYAYSDDNIPF